MTDAPADAILDPSLKAEEKKVEHPVLLLIIAAIAALSFIIALTRIVRSIRTQEKRSAYMLQKMDRRLESTRAGMKSALQTMSLSMGNASSSLTAVSDSMEARQERMRREMDEKLDALKESTDKRLSAMADKLGGDMQQAIETRLGESFRTVSGELEKVYKGLGEMQALAQNVGDLKRVMTGVKTRGVWGEVRLKQLLDDDLPAGSYLENVAVKPGSQERVEFAVKMPGRGDGECVLLPIDSKFPAEDHQRLMTARESGSKEEEKKCRKAFEGAVIEQAKRISGKYILPPVTTDIALMFLPTESLYADVLMTEGLTEKLQSLYKVLPVGPTNLSALLSCLRMGFRTIAVEQRSGEILSMLGGVRREFDSFGEVIDKARTHLEQAAGDLDDVGKHTRALNKKLSDMEKLPGSEE